MTVLVLTGYPRCGKDEFYKTCKKVFPKLNVRRYAYADELKETHRLLLGINNQYEYEDMLHGNDPVKVKIIRDGLAKLGVSMKDKDPHVFVKVVNSKIAKDHADISIITDCRYVEEYKDNISKYRPIIRIVRHSETCNMEEPWNKEIANFEPTYTIVNDESLDEYQYMVERLLVKILHSLW